ncbi:MAG: hypothetical protein RLZZ206_2165 [Cyanobacteriota bacterium]|jgi:hypothetical protein
MPIKTPGFSVRILLQDGDVEGVRFLEIANWTGMAILSPRDRYLDLRNEPEFERTGVYILTGPDPDDEGVTRTYIGRADHLRTRIDNHVKERDWWDSCLCFTTSDDSLTLTHIQFLEAALLEQATKAGQVRLDNVQFPPIPRLGRADRLDLTRFLENVLMLTGMAGLPTFEIVDQSPDQITIDVPNEIGFKFAQYEFHYAGPAADLTANAKYEARKRFVVMQNSMSRISETNSCPDTVRVLRQKLRDEGVLAVNSGSLLFTANHAFNSPSLAAAVIYGGSVNGRSAWKNADSRSINDLDKISLDEQELAEEMTEDATEAMPVDHG